MHGNAKYFVDPAHQKPIPTGHFFRRGLHPLLLEAMRLAARQATTAGTVNLSALLPAFQQLAIDNLWHYTRDGMRQAARELLLQTGNVRRKSFGGMVLKNIPSSVQGIDFSFDLLRPEVVESIRRAAFDLAQSTLDTAATEANRAIQAARATLEAGVKEGASTRDLNRAFYKIFADPYKAARVAQTEASRAFNAGALEAAKASEVVTGLRWLASSDSCPEICAPLNGKTVKLGEAFGKFGKPGPYQTVYHPPAHPHCLLGETPVLVSNPIGAFKAHYRGPCVRIVLVGGETFACTPNHMFLTPTGFASANSLVKGDDVVYCPSPERFIADGPNNYRKPTRIDQVVRSLSESLGMASSSVPVSAEYLHGDAAFCQGYIDVVRTDAFLRHEGDDGFGEFGAEPFLQMALTGVSFVGESDLDSLFNSLLLATNSGVGRLRDSQAFLRRRILVASGQNRSHSLSSAANATSSVLEAGNDSSSGNPVMLGQAQDRLPGLITTHKISNVDVFTHDGPVYDVETRSTCYIIGSGLVSSNCMCTTTSILLNTDVPDRSVSILQQMAFGGSGSTGGGLVLGGVR